MTKLNRRDFLRSAAMTAAGMALAACAQPTPQVVKETVVVEKPVEKIVKETVVVKETVAVKQTVLVEKQVPVEKVITATPPPMTYNEAPMLAELVKAGKLPAVKDRLPSSPLILDTVEEIGKYGGTWRRAYKGISDRWGTDKILYDGLLGWRMPQNGSISIANNVAEKFAVSADSKEYTWYLRKGIKWSDGKPLTTADVKFWYEDLFSSPLSNTYGVKDTKLEGGGKPMVISVVDDFTFKTTFAAANPLLPIFIAASTTGCYYGNRSPNFAAPAHFLKQFHPKYAKKEDLEALVKKYNLKVVDDLLTPQQAPNCYFNNPDVPTIQPWISKNSPQTNQDLYIMERNPYYWQVDKQGNQLPYIDRVTFRFFDNQETFNFWLIGGEIDCQNRHISAADYTLFKENEKKGDYRTILWKEAATLSYFICCEYDKDPVIQKVLNDLRFRQAMSLAINRKEINDVVFQGMYKPRQACPVSGSPDYAADWENYYTQYDPAAANKLLDAMGLDKKGGDGIRLRSDGKPLEIILDAATVAFAGTNDMHQLFMEYMKAVGVKITLKMEERSLWEAREASNDCQMYCWVRDRSAILFADPSGYSSGGGANGVWDTWFRTEGKSGTKPPDGALVYKVKELLNQTLTEGDEKKRTDLWNQMLKITKENLWIIGVCGEAPSIFITKNNLRNVPSGLVQDDPLRGERMGLGQQFFFKS